MPKHLAALLSIFGLASTTVSAEAQILKGSSQHATNENSKAVQKAQPAGKNKQLKLNQQTVGTLTPNAGKSKRENTTETCQATGTCQTQNQAAATKARTATPPPAQKLTLKQETVGNATSKSAGQLTKGNQQITKGNQQITKGNQQITKGNQQLTKGQLTPPPPQNR